MAAPRLPFLYPNLMRAVRSCEPTTYRSIRAPVGSKRAAFHTTRRRQEEAYHRRYGPAAEANLPPSLRPKDEEEASKPARDSPAGKEKEKRDSSKSQQKQPIGQLDESRQEESKNNASNQSSPAEKEVTVESKESDAQAEEAESQDEARISAEEANDAFSSSAEHPEEEQNVHRHIQDNPLDGVFHMPSPSTYLTPTPWGPSGDKPPHLSPAPYVHHFDTYSLVRDLSKGGYGEESAITIMKSVRQILQNNINLAKDSLTSKSDVENETYLFNAACSELQSSLQTARNSEVQRQRASRTQLQHEIDILSQRFNQELAGLKDDIKGMFNDHKMTSREHQRSIDTSVQELNYKITVSLNSDGKSEIEGLRWILTRRAAMAVATSAIMIIIFLKYYSVRKAGTAEKKKEEAAVKDVKKTRIIQDTPEVLPSSLAPGADVGESLG
ncbi:hypothetical protein SI65_03399 [Aspergillus cristatus]|uniref:MOZ protein represents a chromatin-associated acetyltransferase n=1 Tax=Aspergillus cristatus TaxID=573508 RepID=A0A1E3BIY7_ASPCR|nr:hypothetical protein SI65_03399 [Aspergillus cristatus]